MHVGRKSIDWKRAFGLLITFCFLGAMPMACTNAPVDTGGDTTGDNVDGGNDPTGGGATGDDSTGGDGGSDDGSGDDGSGDDGSGDDGSDGGSSDDGGTSGDDTDDTSTDDDDDTSAGDQQPAGKFARFTLAGSESDAESKGIASSQVIAEQAVAGMIEGAPEEAQLVFMDNAGAQTVVDIDESGAFEVTLAEEKEYHVALVEDGRFAAPVIAENAEDESEGTQPSEMLELQYDDMLVNVMAGPFNGVGEPLETDENDMPLGLTNDTEIPGLSEATEVVSEQTDDVDADHDGIPALFDADKDGDGVIDLVDDDVPAAMPEVTESGETIDGAFVFNNLKLDINQLIPPPTSLFTHNDSAVVTIGWMENPAATPAGFTVQRVEAVDVPGWHRFGFATTINDWTIAPGVAGYVGYPTSGASWTGELYRETSGSNLWQVWVQSPDADATLASSFSSYVESGKSVPLNWDLAGSGVPSSNKIDFYRLKVTYTDGTSTIEKFSPASSLFSFRSPGIALAITTSTASHTIDPNDINGIAHPSNPIVWPDDTTKGAISFEALPPKFDVSSSSGTIKGTMNWRFDVFYYDSTGQQIGSVLTAEVPVTYTSGTINLVLPESVLDRTGSRTDMDGDGMNDFQGSFTSDDIAAYKVDLTAVAVTGSDNTGLFYYFVAESQAGTFAGF